MQIFKTNGDAGTGKTYTLVQDITNAAMQGLNIQVVTPTNKAAAVLRERFQKSGINVNVGTIASVMYYYSKESYEPKRWESVPKLSPITGKFEVDVNGDVIITKNEKFKFVKVLKSFDAPTALFIDEASMVQAEFWYHLHEGAFYENYVHRHFGNLEEVHTYGDEKQLPPIEDFENLPTEEKKYVGWWFKQTPTNSLTVNHRQAGALMDFINTCKTALFSKKLKGEFPTGIQTGTGDYSNFSVNPKLHAEVFDECIMSVAKADIIVTQTNQQRMVMNTIFRKINAYINRQVFQFEPVVGDTIIFKTKCKEAPLADDPSKIVYIAKNIYAKIKQIHDFDIKTTGMSCTLELETGETVGPIAVDYYNSVPVSKKRQLKNAPQIDFGYAVTAHSSQGGGWNRVVVIDSWSPHESAPNGRYVAMTRAKETCHIYTGFNKDQVEMFMKYVNEQLTLDVEE